MSVQPTAGRDITRTISQHGSAVAMADVALTAYARRFNLEPLGVEETAGV